MKIYKQTNTLDGLIDDLDFTNSCEEAEVVITGGKTVDIKTYPNLKIIYRTGVSRANLPFDEAKSKGIKIKFPSEIVSGYIFEETADFTCSLIFRMLYDNVGTINPWVKFKRTALSKKKLLVIGNGNIGKKVSKKMSSFMDVVTYDVLNNTEKDLLNALSVADVVTIHIPNTKENENFIDKEKLALMKEGSTLINTARGALINEDALYNEILDNRLKAAFDVYWEEPYTGKLSKFSSDKFFMTPHTASTCDDFLIGAAQDLRTIIEENTNA